MHIYLYLTIWSYGSTRNMGLRDPPKTCGLFHWIVQINFQEARINKLTYVHYYFILISISKAYFISRFVTYIYSWYLLFHYVASCWFTFTYITCLYISFHLIPLVDRSGNSSLAYPDCWFVGQQGRGSIVVY